MEQHLQVIEAALNQANQRGAYDLRQSATIAHSLEAVKAELTKNQEEEQRG